MAVALTSADRGQLLAYLDQMTGDLQRVREHLEVVAARNGQRLNRDTTARLDRVGDDLEVLFDRVNVAPLIVG